MGDGGIEFRVRPFDPARPLLGPMLASDGLLVAIRRTVLTSALVFAGVCLLVGFSDDLSAADTTSRVVAGVTAAGAVAGAVWMQRSRAPLAGRGAVLFGVFADLGVVAVVGVVESPRDQAIGAISFVLPGVFVMMHLARAWLLAHLVLAFMVIVAIGVRLLLTGSEPPVVALVGALVVLAVVVVTPWTLRASFVQVMERAERAFIDPVTGVLNRWGLEAALHGLRAAPQPADVSVMVVDIDRFKTVNDDHGHDAGDRVLRQVADDLAAYAEARSGVVARTGGEEFAVVVPGAVRDLSAVPVVSGGRGGDPSVTLSSGVTTVDVRSVAADGAAAALAEADRLMYRSKRTGGGRATRSHAEARSA